MSTPIPALDFTIVLKYEEFFRLSSPQDTVQILVRHPDAETLILVCNSKSHGLLVFKVLGPDLSDEFLQKVMEDTNFSGIKQSIWGYWKIIQGGPGVKVLKQTMMKGYAIWDMV